MAYVFNSHKFFDVFLETVVAALLVSHAVNPITEETYGWKLKSTYLIEES